MKNNFFNTGTNISKEEAAKRAADANMHKPVMPLVRVHAIKLVICLLMIGTQIIQILPERPFGPFMYMASGVIMMFVFAYQDKFRPDVEDELAKENLNKAYKASRKTALGICMLCLLALAFVEKTPVISIRVYSILNLVLLIAFAFLALEHIFFIYYEKKGSSDIEEE